MATPMNRALKRLLSWIVVIGVSLAVLGVALSTSILGKPSELAISLGSALLALGLTITGTGIFYYAYNRLAEIEIMREVALRVSEAATHEATKKAVGAAEEWFKNRFARLMPIKTYPKSETPQEEYNSDYLRYLRDSPFFYFKGDSAEIASYRLQLLTD